MGSLEVGVVMMMSVVALYLLAGIRIVRQEEKFVVEFLGRFARVTGPGLVIVLPGLERVAFRPSTRKQVIEKLEVETLTQDSVTVKLTTALYYQIVSFYRAAYNVELGPGSTFAKRIEFALTQLATSTLRAVVGRHDFNFVLDHQKEINDEVVQAMRDEVEKWGIAVARHEILELEPPPEIKDALVRQIRAEKEALAAIAEAEGTAKATVIRSEADKTAAVNAAEAAKQRDILAAEAKKRAQVLDAEGEAEAVERMAAAIAAPGGEASVQFRLADKQIDALKEALAEGSSTFIIPAGMEGIAAITAMFKTIPGAGGTKPPTA